MTPYENVTDRFIRKIKQDKDAEKTSTVDNTGFVRGADYYGRKKK